MFLLAQLFSREAQRPDTVEYWPAANGSDPATAVTGNELTSPTRQFGKASSGGELHVVFKHWTLFCYYIIMEKK